jgi:hypothetical protein
MGKAYPKYTDYKKQNPHIHPAEKEGCEGFMPISENK